MLIALSTGASTETALSTTELGVDDEPELQAASTKIEGTKSEIERVCMFIDARVLHCEPTSPDSFDAGICAGLSDEPILDPLVRAYRSARKYDVPIGALTATSFG